MSLQLCLKLPDCSRFKFHILKMQALGFQHQFHQFFLQYLVTPSSFCFQSFHPLIFKSLLLQYFTSAVFFFIFFQPNIVHNACVTRTFLSMDCVISTFSTLPNALITSSLDVVQLQIPLTYFRLSNLNSLKIHFLSVHFYEIKP